MCLTSLLTLIKSIKERCFSLTHRWLWINVFKLALFNYKCKIMNACMNESLSLKHQYSINTMAASIDAESPGSWHKLPTHFWVPLYQLTQPQFELGPAAVAWYSIHMLTYQKVWAKKQRFLFSSPMVRVTGWRLLHNCKAKDRQITVQKTPAHYSIHLESVTLIKMFCCQDLHQVMKHSRRDHLKQTD